MGRRQFRRIPPFLAGTILFGISVPLSAHDLRAVHFERENNKKLLESRYRSLKIEGTETPSAVSSPSSENAPFPNVLSKQQIRVINQSIDKETALQVLTGAVRPGLPADATSFRQIIIPKSVISRAKTWDAGSTLKVCFVEQGAVDAKRAIARYAAEWTKWGNIKFDFGSESRPRTCADKDGSVIRITFNTEEYASYVGTDAKAFAQLNQPTMFLSSFDTENYTSEKYRATVLHEFGHALGFQHEHQHPTAECEKQFDLERIKKLYKWSDEDISVNISQIKVSNAYRGTGGITTGENKKEGEVAFTEYDKDSIMHYALERSIFKQPPGSCYITNENAELSARDKKGMAFAYPNISAAALNTRHNKEIDRFLIINKNLSMLEREALKALRR